MRSFRTAACVVIMTAAPAALLSCSKKPTGPDNPSPYTISIVSGDGQLGLPGQPLSQPLVVRVVDPQGEPVYGQPVYWSLSQGKADLYPLSKLLNITDAKGETRLYVRSGDIKELIVVRAEIYLQNHDVVQFRLRSLPLDYARFEPVSEIGYTWPVGRTLPDPLRVRVFDRLDQPVQGRPVTFYTAANSGFPTPAVDTTDSAGYAQTIWTLDSAAAIQSLYVALGKDTSARTFWAQGVYDDPAVLSIVSGDSARGEQGKEVAAWLGVHVTDRFGHLLDSVAVSFTVRQGDARMVYDTALTNSKGVVYDRFYFGENADPIEIEAAVPASPSAGSVVFHAQAYPETRVRVAAIEPSAVDVCWNSIQDPDFEGFDLYRNGSFVGSSASPLDTIFRDTNVVVGQSYAYEVEMRYANYSFFSNRADTIAGMTVPLPATASDVAYDSARHCFYVSFRDDPQIAVIDEASFTVTQTLAAGVPMADISLSAGRDKLLMVPVNGDAFYRLDLATHAVDSTHVASEIGSIGVGGVGEIASSQYVVVGTQPHSFIIISGPAGWAWTANFEQTESTASVIPDLAHACAYVVEQQPGRPIRKLEFQGDSVRVVASSVLTYGASGGVVSLDGAYMYLSDGSVLETESLSLVERFSYGMPVLNESGTAVYIPALGISKYDAATGFLIQSVPTLAPLNRIAVRADEQYAVGVENQRLHVVPLN